MLIDDTLTYYHMVVPTSQLYVRMCGYQIQVLLIQGKSSIGENSDKYSCHEVTGSVSNIMNVCVLFI